MISNDVVASATARMQRSSVVALVGIILSVSGCEADQNETTDATSATSSPKAGSNAAESGKASEAVVQAGAAAPAGAGGATGEDFWPSDCEDRYKLVAHGKPGVSDSTVHEVPGESEYYASFFFKAPWGAKEVQALAFKHIIDNRKVVHHWILYGVNNDTSQQDGAIAADAGHLLPTTLSGELFITGWAPGGLDVKFPKSLGLYMPHGEDAMLRLEIHYNNVVGAEKQPDHSGVELCVTSKKRDVEVATHWLGNTDFTVAPHTKKEVVGTCVPKLASGPVRVLSMTPHMHQTGVHAKAVLKRSSGEEVTLLDQPFSFGDQRSFPVPTDQSIAEVILNEGDTIITTCTFDNQTDAPITYGEKTTDEMCYFFTTAFPRGGLSNGEGSRIPGAESSISCLQ